MSWLQKLLPPRIKASPGTRKTVGARRAVDQVPVVRGGALSHRPREEPATSARSAATTRALTARERIDQLLDAGRPLRDRLRSRAGRQPQVQGHASKYPERLDGRARGNRRDRRAGRHAGQHQERAAGARRVRVRLHGRLDGLGRRRALRARRARRRTSNRVPFVCITATRRRAHAGRRQLAVADGQDHRGAAGADQGAAAVRLDADRSDDGRRVGELRVRRRPRASPSRAR